MIDHQLINRVDAASKKSINKWGGGPFQINMLREECAELMLELARIPRNRTNKNKIVEECVDVYIMIHQMMEIYGKDIFEKFLVSKVTRLEERLESHP